MRFKVTEKIDTWGLNCIMANMIVWLLQGWKEVDQFLEDRKLEANKYLGKNSGCFHKGDGKSVLDTVPRRLQLYKDCADSRTDRLTLDIIKVVDDVFQCTPDDRPSAQALTTRYDIIIKSAEKLCKEKEEDDDNRALARLNKLPGLDRPSQSYQNTSDQRDARVADSSRLRNGKPRVGSSPAFLHNLIQPVRTSLEDQIPNKEPLKATQPKITVPFLTTKDAIREMEEYKRNLTWWKRLRRIVFTSDLSYAPEKARPFLSRLKHTNIVSCLT
jgi:hypothetical protein